MGWIERRDTTRGRRYDVRYRAPDGRKRLAGTFRTLDAARAALRTIEGDLARGTWADPRLAAVPFGQVATDWLASNPGKRPSTRARDEIVLRLHVLPAVGATPVGELTPARIQQLVNGWAERYAPRTVHRHYETLRAVLNFALARDLIVRSPCRGIRLPRVEPRRRPPLDPDRVVALAEACGEEAPIVWLAVLAGLRWGEIAGLRVGALDLLAGTVTVREQHTRGERGQTWVGPPKSAAGHRTVAIPPVLVGMLAEHLARRGLTGADRDALVFTAGGGAPLDYANWRRRWCRACEQVGIEGLTFHDLRAWHATALVGAGVDVRTAQARLGHSDPRLTLAVYAQASSAADRAAADRVAGLFEAASGTGCPMDARSATTGGRPQGGPHPR